MKRLLAFSIASLLLTACLPPPSAPQPTEPSNKLGQAKWGEMKYEAK